MSAVDNRYLTDSLGNRVYCDDIVEHKEEKHCEVINIVPHDGEWKFYVRFTFGSSKFLRMARPSETKLVESKRSKA